MKELDIRILFEEFLEDPLYSSNFKNNIDVLLLENDIKFRLDKWFLNYKLDKNFIDDITNYKTILPNFIFTSSDDCIKGFLSGYFRSCTYENGNIKIFSNNHIILNGINFLLSYFQIFAFIHINTLTIKPEYTEYFEKHVIEEIWKELHPEFLLSSYQISNLGRIKNIKTNYISKIKPRKDTNTVQFNLKDDDKVYYGNMLVGKTFILNIKKDCIDHINRYKSDNRLSNLRWATYSENSKNKIHKYKKGKKVDQYDLKDNLIKTWNKISDVEEELKINHTNILKVINGKKTDAGGFIWKYNIENIKGEIWKKVPIKEIEDTYVSNFGRIKRRNDDRTITYGSVRKDGYCTISIPLKIQPENIKRKITKGFQVHKLVGLTFLENKDKKEYINHINENRSDNKVANLCWVTNSENVNHSLNLKNRKNDNVLQKQILQIDPKTNKIINKFRSFVDASETLNITKTGIQSCIYGKQKTFFGYIWKTEETIEKENIKKKYNVYFDKVINIKYVKGSTDYVYDLTVENTRNFQLFNGLNVRDTLIKG